MTIDYIPYKLTPGQVAELWDDYGAGQTVSQLARRFGKKQGSMCSAPGGGRDSAHDPDTGGAASHARGPRGDLARARGRALAAPDRRTAGTLPPSTISREVENNSGWARYRAVAADRAAIQHRKRPKPCKLATSTRLAHLVEAKLQRKWS